MLARRLPTAFRPSPLREQLGLTREAATGKVQAVVIDHIDRPSGNWAVYLRKRAILSARLRS
jgi:hypothetical protein